MASAPRLGIALTLIVATVLLAACTATPTTPGDTPTTVPGQQTTQSGVTVTGTYTPPPRYEPGMDATPRRFRDTEELQAFVRDHEQSGGYGYAKGGIRMESAADRGVAMDAAVPQAVPVAGSATTAEAAPSFSGTNNQVLGVDEADTTKTDGKYIYTITGDTVFIVEAGEDARVVGTIKRKQAPQALFIDGDRLVVIGQLYDLEYFKRIGIIPDSGMTEVAIYDVSDHAAPELLSEVRYEGQYHQARMIDGKAYLVILSSPQSRDLPMPLIVEGESVRHVAIDHMYYRPIPYDSVQFATVHALDISSGKTTDSKTIAVSWDTTIYMSTQNLYLATTENINEWEISQDVTMELLKDELTAQDKVRIEKLQAADSDVLSPAEKRNKIAEIYNRYVQYMDSDAQQAFQKEVDKETQARIEKYEALTYTVITRIAADDGLLDVAATGQVPGQLNNQFAMDEYDGVLRVATTIRQSWWMTRFFDSMPVDDVAIGPTPDAKMISPRPRNAESENRVTTLDMDLKTLGALKEIAVGEQIYSTRFIGDRLYMVTFRQVDPFFVIDLSDPKKPQSLGELKIPGFSRYLHPYDDHTIIGIGRDATDSGRQLGLKISLFDVTDVSEPKEVAQFVTDEQYAQSTAEYEHKAFLFDREKQLLVIPAYSQEWDWRGATKQRYNGAMVFNITASNIKLRGIVDHSQGNTQYWSAQVERSLYIGDLLYTKSPSLIRVNRLSDLLGVTNVTLSATSTGPYPVY
jgi:uncharacterized secreted protein with C-terminal beta-propeller domain